MSLWLNSGGTWVAWQPSVKVGSTWQPWLASWVNIGGTWKQSYTAVKITLTPTLLSHNTTTGIYTYTCSASASSGTPSSYVWSLSSGAITSGQSTDDVSFTTSVPNAVVTCVVTVGGFAITQSITLSS